MALRRQQFTQHLPVAVGVGQVQRGVHLVDAEGLQLRCQRLAMVDDVRGAQLPAPGAAFLARCGRHHGESGMAAELDRHRADAARAADDQQGPAAVAAAIELVGHALEQQLPGGERGQRQGRGFGEIQRARLARHQSFIHQVHLCVAARPGDIAGVVHLVPHLERGHLGADGQDGARGVETEDAGRRVFALARTPQLGIDRVDRHCLHAHQQVLPLRGGGRGQFDVFQRAGILDRQGVAQAHSFHGRSSVR